MPHLRWFISILVFGIVFAVPSVAPAADGIDSSLAKADPSGAILWYDLGLLDVEGKGWAETKAPYDRLPARAESVVREPVWNLSRHSAGLCVRFVTDATAVHARWTVTSKDLALPHMPATGVSGLDLYIRQPKEDRWQWLAVGRPTQSPTNTVQLVSGLSAGQREFLLYLPLYNGVSSVEIGIPKESTLAKGPARPAEKRKPIVFYGTSITQGGCASRPGMVHTALLGRQLDRPIINLGFSGNGKMDPEVGKLLAELDPAVYVIDCLPNMDARQVEERTEPLVRTLLQAHPKTPILLVEDRTYANAPALESLRERQSASRAALRKVYDKLVADKVDNVHYLAGDKLLGDDGEATVDGSHPTDLGFVRQAEAFKTALTPLLAATPAKQPEPALAPPVRTIDVNVGEQQEVELVGGKKVSVKLLDLQETRDDLRKAVRRAEVQVEVDGQKVSLVSANYRLPVTVGGVQIDCPITRGYRQDNSKGVAGEDPWGLDKDARLRLWPAGAPLINPGTFVYPVKQRWFASGTQMANEPVHVDGGENPLVKKIYYHYGLDIGGAEAMVEVVAATDGVVVSSGKAVLPGYEDSPVQPRYDVIYILDQRGWYYRYSHLHTIGPDVTPGARVKMGQRLGLLGKEGGSGGWSHLHFDISGRQPSGKWGIIEGYAFLWEAYLKEQQPKLLAVARPHHLAAVGQKVVLDGTRSWSADGKIASFEWTFDDGKTANGRTVEKTYSRPGVYSEVLKVADSAGRIDYDFAVVNVLDPDHADQLPPSIHAVYFPTFGISPGDPVTFLVRTFRTTDGTETWDFGDGGAKVEVQSDGNVVPLAKDGYARTVHRYAKPGHYLVRVERTDRRGFTAVAHLQVRVGEDRSRVDLRDFTKIKDVRAALVAPDGQRVAYLVAIPDLQSNQVKTQCWLVPVGEGEPRQLPLETESIEKILWSPKGAQLAVVGKAIQQPPEQKGETWLWVVDVDTGKSKRLLSLHQSNHYLAHQGANLCWSPDGASLAYLATDNEAPPPVSDPIVVNRIQYKTRTALSDNRPTHIWIVQAASGNTRQLTTGRYDEHSIDWSPRGDEIVFCSNRGPDPDANLNYDLFAVRIADGTITQLTRTAGSEMTPVWSPDGRSLAYTMTKRPLTTIDSVAEDDHVWVLDRESGQARDVTAGLDRRCAQVRWDAGGKTLLFLARDHGRSLIYRVPATGGEATPLFETAGMVTTFSPPSGPGIGVCVLSSSTQSPEVWTFNAEGKVRVMRTHLNVDETVRWQPVEPEEVQCKSFDGTPIQGWLLLPPGATPGNKVPLILAIHGGPHGMYGHSFSTMFQLLVARGYAVLYLNPRGSNGYGQRFSDGCVNDWGGGDYKDLMAGLDHVLAKYPQLDAERLGVTGGSYGGYMTNWIITQTSRFRAAVTYASLSNLISFYATSLYQDLIHVEFNGEPWEHYDLLWERSPLRHIKRVTTPTLILHGEADNDVHITQAEELYTALKRRGVETQFVRYPREGHGSTEPRHQLDQLERTVAWFDRFLQPKSQPVEAKP